MSNDEQPEVEGFAPGVDASTSTFTCPKCQTARDCQALNPRCLTCGYQDPRTFVRPKDFEYEMGPWMSLTKENVDAVWGKSAAPATPAAEIVVSANEAERIAKLRVAFIAQLATWVGTMTGTVHHSPGVERALVESMIDMAIVTFLAAQLPDDEVGIAKVVLGLREQIMAVLDCAKR